MINKSILKSLLFLILLCGTHITKAEVKLPAIFGDHMVLQQQTDTAIWGTALPHKTVSKISRLGLLW